MLLIPDQNRDLSLHGECRSKGLGQADRGGLALVSARADQADQGRGFGVGGQVAAQRHQRAGSVTKKLAIKLRERVIRDYAVQHISLGCDRPQEGEELAATVWRHALAPEIAVLVIGDDHLGRGRSAKQWRAGDVPARAFGPFPFRCGDADGNRRGGWRREHRRIIGKPIGPMRDQLACARQHLHFHGNAAAKIAHLPHADGRRAGTCFSEHDPGLARGRHEPGHGERVGGRGRANHQCGIAGASEHAAHAAANGPQRLVANWKRIGKAAARCP